MKLIESINKNGYFCFPMISEQKMPGVLHISEFGDINIDIMGMYGEDFPNFHTSGKENFERIVGILETGEIVTLDKCFYTQIKDNPNSFSTAKFYGNIALIGHEYSHDENIEFHQVAFSMPGLFEWLSISGISTQSKWEDSSTSIEFKPPEDIQLLLNDGMSLKFRFGWSKSNSRQELNIKQKIYVLLESENPKSLDDFRSIIFKLNNFFCFAMDTIAAIDYMVGYSKDITEDIGNGTIIEAPIHVYYNSHYSENDNTSKMYNFLFSYKDVELQLQDIIKSWLCKYSILEPAFNLYFL